MEKTMQEMLKLLQNQQKEIAEISEKMTSQQRDQDTRISSLNSRLDNMEQLYKTEFEAAIATVKRSVIISNKNHSFGEWTKIRARRS